MAVSRLSYFVTTLFLLVQGGAGQFDYTRPPPGEPICPGSPQSFDLGPGNIIANPGFSTLPPSWGCYSCEIAPANGQAAAAFNRPTNDAGVEWDVSSSMTQTGAYYKLAAWVKIYGPQTNTVRGATIDLFMGGCPTCKSGTVFAGTPPEYKDAFGGPWRIAQGVVSTECWTLLTGEHLLYASTSQKTIRFNGPQADSMLLIRSIQLVPTNFNDYIASANGRIEANRKSGLNVRVVDGAGNPVPNAQVKVQQTGTSFAWGGGMTADFAFNQGLTDRFKSLGFSYAAPYNELKWYAMEPQKGNLVYGPADAVMTWARNNGFKVRANNIFWEQYNPPNDIGQNPIWVTSSGLSKDELRQRMALRVRDVVGWASQNYPGVVADWDVDNENWHSDFYGNYLGDESIHEWMYKEANKYDQFAGLAPNDYNFFERIDLAPYAQQESTGDLGQWLGKILDLKSKGCRINTIGLQGQYGLNVGNGYGNLPQPGHITRIFDQVQAAGFGIWITELNIRINDEFSRAKNLETLLREFMAHPAVLGVITWGWDYSPDSATTWVDSNGNPNAAGQKYLSLRSQWTTNESGSTGGDGNAFFRAFHGSHAVTVSANGQTTTQSVDVGPGGDASVTIKLGGRRRAARKLTAAE